MEDIYFPELEPLRKRKSYRQEILRESEYYAKAVIPFVCENPSYSWSQLLPSDEAKIKENKHCAKIQNRKIIQ